MGATMAAHYLATSSSPVVAFVAIGTGPGIGGSNIDNVRAINDIAVPVLDLYGGDDLEAVLNSANARGAALRHASSRQIKVDGADHFFQGAEEPLVSAVSGWLDGIVD